MALVLEHQTAQEFVARLRERYRQSSREECARLATWIYDRYVAGDVTEAQIRNAFGLTTDPEWIIFRDKIQALRNSWVIVQTAEGE